MAEKTSDWRPGPTVCRCCLAEGCYKDISTEYFWMGKREVYAEMLSDTLSVSIAYSQSGGPNSNSRLICESCISRLRDATDFKRQVLECEKTFMNLLDPGSSTLVKELQLSMEEVKVEHVKTEKASMSDDDFDDQVDFVVENDDDDDDDDLDDEPLMKLASKEPKKEVNITELLKNSQVTVKRKAAVKAKAPPAKKAKKQIVIKPTASKAAAKATASSTPKTEKKKKGVINDSDFDVQSDRGDRSTLTEIKTRNSLDDCLYGEAIPTVTYDIHSATTNTISTKKRLLTVLSKPIPIRDATHWKPVQLHELYERSPTPNIKFESLVPSSRKRDCDSDYEYESETEFLETPRKVTVLENDTQPLKIRDSPQMAMNFEFVQSLSSSKNDIDSGHEYSDATGASTKCQIRELNEDSTTGVDQRVVKKPGRSRMVDLQLEDWKKHTIKVLQNSFVYPFAYSYNRYKCFVCHKPFLDTCLLKKHATKHTIEEVIYRMNNKFRDMILKVDVTDLRCGICCNTCDSLKDLKSHLRDAHGIDLDPDYQDNLLPIKLGDKTFQCVICEEVCSNIRNLLSHIRQHFSNYKCEICGSGYITKNTLKQHLYIHDTGTYKCEVCDKVYSSAYKKARHFRTSHLTMANEKCPFCPAKMFSLYQKAQHLRIVHNRSKGLYTCNICKKTFDIRSDLLEHTQNDHSLQFECSICHSQFYENSKLKKHMLAHKERFTCETCGASYGIKMNLIKHIRSHDVQDSNVDGIPAIQRSSDEVKLVKRKRCNRVTSSKNVTWLERENAANFIAFTTAIPFIFRQAAFMCFYCSDVYTEVNVLLEHAAIHSPSRLYVINEIKKKIGFVRVDISELKCRFCHEEYSELDDIREHLTSAHSITFTSDGSGLMTYKLSGTNISCHKCHKEFTTFATLNSHVNRHHGEVVCETCGLRFNNHDRLECHMDVHKNIPFQCNTCEEVFPSKGSLRYHVMTSHENENVKRLKCPHCSERFKDNHQKLKHIQEDHGIFFEFECNICNTVFNSRRMLTVHMRKFHLKTFKCDVCDKCFESNVRLKQHAYTHTGVRSFECPICKKGFLSDKALRYHLSAIHSLRSFCYKCGKRCSNQYDLRKHNRKFHSKINT